MYPMKVQYASDLHIEFPVNASFLEKIPLSDESNILVLAGDIAYLEKKMLKNHPFFDWCSRTFEQTLIIPGNHEFYRGYPVDNTLDGWEYFVRPNVRYINNKSFSIGDVEIFCTTLWSEIDQLAEKTVQNGMSDFHCIKYNGHTLVAADYGRLHKVCVDWLDKALDKSTAKHKVVVTHHCPTLDERYTKYKESLLQTAFMADMEDFIHKHSDIEYWIFGHTHFNDIPKGDDAKIGNTRILCNQMGYIEWDEMAGFRQDAIIHFDEE